MRMFLLTALTMLAFAGNSVLNRAAVGAGAIDPLAFAGLRLLAGAATLMVLLASRGGGLWPGRRGRLTGTVALLAYLFGFSLAYRGLDAGTGALVLFGTVQITMFAGAILGGEAVPPRRWAGAAVAFGGLVLLLAPGGTAGGTAAFALMAVAGVGWGVYSLSGRGHADALGATAWNFALGVPVGLAVLLAAPMEQATGFGILLAIVSGAVTSGLGYALWYAILPGLGAGRAAVAQLTVPLIAAAGGLALLGEGVTPRFALAAVLVLGGVALALTRARGN